MRAHAMGEGGGGGGRGCDTSTRVDPGLELLPSCLDRSTCTSDAQACNGKLWISIVGGAPAAKKAYCLKGRGHEKRLTGGRCGSNVRTRGGEGS